MAIARNAKPSGFAIGGGARVTLYLSEHEKELLLIACKDRMMTREDVAKDLLVKALKASYENQA